MDNDDSGSTYFFCDLNIVFLFVFEYWWEYIG